MSADWLEDDAMTPDETAARFFSLRPATIAAPVTATLHAPLQPARLAYLRQTATTALAQGTGATWGPEVILDLLDHIAEMSAP